MRPTLFAAVSLTGVSGDEWPSLPARYEDRGLLGVGGMCVVRRVYDRELERVAAMKFLRAELASTDSVLRRFAREARTTASLQHPGILPIYDHGQLPDGRPYFTMPEVHGRTLEDAPSATSLRARMETLARVCDAVAFGHTRGVVHGDIKPANVMLGDFGQVLVLDWGIARVVRPGEAGEVGAVTGTPAYMSPEQARAELATPASDVYSLGALMHELLLDRPPFDEDDPGAILARLAAGDVPECAGAGLPRDLVDLVNAAMSPLVEERDLTAAGLGERLRAWLDEETRRGEALRAVGDADARLAFAAEASRDAARLAAEAQRLLAAVPSHAPESEKEPAWRIEDAARERSRAGALATAEAVRDLRAAIGWDPTCRPAHDRLADHYQAEHARAEALRDEAGADRLEGLVRAHGARRHVRWLAGTGVLSLHTDPPGATVECLVYRRVGRRLVEQPHSHLGTTPLVQVPLPMGSYVLLVRLPGHQEVRYPVEIGRMTHWDGVPPEGDGPHSIRLPRVGELPEGSVYVPAGWTNLGGDDLATFGLPASRVWVDGFVIDRDPLTNRRLLALLNEVAGRTDAQLPIPRARGSADVRYYRQDEGGVWERALDADGELWDLDWPVFLVDWWDALAASSLRAGHGALPWRLPTEGEREKAARGVDRRAFPWGDHFDASFCCMRESHAGRPLPSVVGGGWADVSPYGVRGLAGNIRDWCVDRVEPGATRAREGRLSVPPPAPEVLDPRAIRGGSWLSPSSVVRAAARQNARPTERNESIGIRHVASFG